MSIPAPWLLTHDELLAVRLPSKRGDRSGDPSTVARLREDGSTLADYREDFVPEWLGVGSLPSYATPGLRGAIREGAPLAIYRATDAEEVIWPGAYVTLSRRYAEEHARAHLHGPGIRILTAAATADDLIPVNPQEFWFAPRDLHAWHASVVADAVARGVSVPRRILADFGLLPPPRRTR